MVSSHREAVLQRNAAITALKQIVKSKNVFQMWQIAYAALSQLPSTETARKELALLTKKEGKREGT